MREIYLILYTYIIKIVYLKEYVYVYSFNHIISIISLNSIPYTSCVHSLFRRYIYRIHQVRHKQGTKEDGRVKERVDRNVWKRRKFKHERK
jgi:hypothetical protein